MSQQIVSIAVDNLQFDPLNPRVPLTGLDKSKQEEIINWMLIDASILELMGSIGEKGFFPAEPLLVVEIKDKKGHYHVIEGNRRLTAVKLLLYPELAGKRSKSVAMIAKEAKQKPTKLPVFVYEKRSDILDYLGFKHITGVKSWGALAKARYLNSLKKSYASLPLKEQYKSLAKAIGSRSDYVEQLLNGLAVFEKIKEHDYFDVKGLNESSIEFGVYYNALRWTNIRKLLGMDSPEGILSKVEEINNLKKIVKWVSEKNAENSTRLGESRNLSKLNKILGSAKALDAFEKGVSLDQAFRLTDEPNSLFSRSIEEALNHIQVANNYIHLVNNKNELNTQRLKEIKSIATNLRVLLIAKEEDDA